jgi:hypothetical protein
MSSVHKTPLDLAQRIYETEWCARTFPQDLCLHLRHGWVLSSPSFFMMGRPVLHTAPESLILDPTHRFDNADAWLVWVAAGSHPRELIRHMPFQLPYLGWQKRNRLRWYATRAFQGREQRSAGSVPDDQQSGARCSVGDRCASEEFTIGASRNGNPDAPAQRECCSESRHSSSCGGESTPRSDVHDPCAARDVRRSGKIATWRLNPT